VRPVPEKAPPLRVLLVDDHEVVRSGVKALLQATEDVLVSAEARLGA
jgi:DNA-binding NarL/FixJ family response regulator